MIIFGKKAKACKIIFMLNSTVLEINVYEQHINIKIPNSVLSQSLKQAPWS